jgi:hypothetical protein
VNAASVQPSSRYGATRTFTASVVVYREPPSHLSFSVHWTANLCTSAQYESRFEGAVICRSPSETLECMRSMCGSLKPAMKVTYMSFGGFISVLLLHIAFFPVQTHARLHFRVSYGQRRTRILGLRVATSECHGVVCMMICSLDGPVPTQERSACNARM